MKRNQVLMIAEAGAMLAIAYVLSNIRIYEAPYGGSVTAGSMVPIIIFALRWGLGPGIFMGVAHGILQFLLGPKYSLHIASILFDYVVAFGFVGFAGLLRSSLTASFAGTFIGVFGRFICHVLSGVIVWVSYTPEGMNPWIYSLLYNAYYLVPELIISIIFIGLLYKPVIKRIGTMR